MLSRWIARAAMAIVVLGCVVPAHAEGFGDFFASFPRDFKRRNCWPYPFIEADRQTAREPFAAMVSNGWERQNMLSDAHFELAGTHLSEAGRLKVLTILNEAPDQHRMVVVHRAATPIETSVRMQTVQQFVSESAYNGQTAPIVESNRPDDLWPADRVDMISRKAMSAAMDPKLPAASAGGTSGGSH